MGQSVFLSRLSGISGPPRWRKSIRTRSTVPRARYIPRRRMQPNIAEFYTPTCAVMTHAARRGWCAPLVLQRPRQPPGRTRWLKPDEADRLIDACGAHLQPLVIFMLYTGARVGEALWLDWRNVDLARAHVMFEKTKNGQPRGVPLHHRVVVALAALAYREAEVFRRPDGFLRAPRCRRCGYLRWHKDKDGLRGGMPTRRD